MKNLRQLCAVAVLTLMLAFSAYAGEMSYPVVPPPPQQQMAAGEMDFPITATGEAMSGEATGVDLWTGVALTLMRSALSVF
jgi:putative hemolysin